MPRVTTITPNPAKVGDSLVVDGTGYGTQATLITALSGANNDLLFTARNPGTGGNAITVAYVVSGNNTALSVAVVSNAITVTVATGGGGAATSTAAQVKAAIEASAPATALVGIAYPASNDGTGIVTALGATNLTGGASQTVEVEFLKSSNADVDVRYSEVADASGAWGSAGNLTYKVQEPGGVLIRVRVASVVVDEQEVQVRTVSG